jgi:hypothetical protein
VQTRSQSAGWISALQVQDGSLVLRPVRSHAGTYVILLVQDLDVRIVNAATGELLRELTLDPTRD